MKKLLLTVTAFLFVCAIALTLNYTAASHTKRVKTALPTYARKLKS